MKENIVDNIESIIKNNAPAYEQIEGFIKADEEFKKLLQEGLTIKRGYTLLTTDEIYHAPSGYVFSQSNIL